MSLQEVQTLFDIKKAQITLARQRGLVVPEEEEHMDDLSLFQFEESYRRYAEERQMSFRRALSRLYTAVDGSNCTYIHFVEHSGGKDVLVSSIRIFIADVQQIEEAVTSGSIPPLSETILIIPTRLQANASKQLTELKGTLKVTTFTDSDMLNITMEHMLIPRHVVLTEQEKIILLAKYRTTVDEIPSIREDDPQVRFLGYGPGTIFRIERINLYGTSAKHSVYYRSVKAVDG